MKTIAVYSIKGGVGKTASSVNLAYLASKEGARTLIWDLDPQAATTFYFRVKPKLKGGARKLIRGRIKLDQRIRGTDFDGLDLLPADFSYRKMDIELQSNKKPLKRMARLLAPLAEAYDYLFLDCPPGISLASESVFAAANLLLVPTIPTTLSIRSLEQLKRHLRRHGPKGLQLAPFLSMVDQRKALHREICAAAADMDFLATRIPYSSIVERMGVARTPLHVFAYSSVPAAAYENLWHEIRSRLQTSKEGRS